MGTTAASALRIKTLLPRYGRTPLSRARPLNSNGQRLRRIPFSKTAVVQPQWASESSTGLVKAEIVRVSSLEFPVP